MPDDASFPPAGPSLARMYMPATRLTYPPIPSIAFAALLFVTAAASDAATLFEGARVIVDARKAPIENAAFVVDNGRIARIGAKGTIQAPAGSTRVDLTGKTVIPALIDTHIHIGYQKGLSYSASNYDRHNLTDQLQRYAYAGVSAVMSLGTDPGETASQQQAEQERKGGTLLLTAGRGIAAPDAGPGDAALKPSAWSVSTEEAARDAVRAEAARKAAFIKVWVDDRGGTVKKTPPEIYRAVIDEAHKHGVRAIAHVYYLDDAKDLARSGIDGFAHLVRDREVDQELIGLLKSRGITVMPNLNIAANRTLSKAPDWLDDPLLHETTPQLILNQMRVSYTSRTPQAVEAAQRTYRIMQANLAKLNTVGVRIVLGADSGAVPGHFHAFPSHRELELMVDAGMKPSETLAAATVSAASFLRLKNRGTLEPGNIADFLVLDANPMDNIRNTRKISGVYLGGKELDRAALRKSWEE
jgi:imidazolonepropionase-like amidohydrolase